MQGRYEWVLLMEALLISGVFLLRQLSRLLCHAVGGSVVSYRVLQLFAVADPERARGMCPHRQTAIFHVKNTANH